MQFAILDTFDAVASLSEEWHALLDRSCCNRAFSSPAWWAAAVRAVPPDAHHVLTARRQGQLCGLLPLVISNGRARFCGKLADYQDMVVDRDDDETGERLLAFALGERMPPVDFHFCREDSQVVNAMAALHPDWSFTDLDDRVGCCHIDLADDFDRYLETRSYMFRQHLRRALRKSVRNELEICEVTPGSLTPESLPDLFLSLHFQSMGEASCFHEAHHAAFVHEALPALFRQRRLRVLGLFQNERQLGIDLYTVGPDYLGNWNAGFAAESTRWSPGKLMLTHAIKTGFAEGLAQIDMLRGLQPWKLGWATGQHAFAHFKAS